MASRLLSPPAVNARRFCQSENTKNSGKQQGDALLSSGFDSEAERHRFFFIQTAIDEIFPTPPFSGWRSSGLSTLRDCHSRRDLSNAALFRTGSTTLAVWTEYMTFENRPSACVF